jgi:DNA ligase-1
MSNPSEKDMVGIASRGVSRRRCLASIASLIAVAPCGRAVAASAPSLLLAREGTLEMDPSGWLVSEKYDGVRAAWDGRALRFRSGLPIAAPTWFTARLPSQPLDGELWLARGRFEPLAGAVRRLQPRDDEWRALSYRVFELPDAPGDFASRVARLEGVVARAQWPQLVAVEQQALADRAALRRRFEEVVQAGGEGLVLHRADAPYEAGRSGALLKLKPVQDADAIVVGHLPGRGRHAGRLGALKLRAEDGSTFQIGTGLDDAQRKSPPPVGSTVTYTYRGRTAGGQPRFASFLRVRADL